jgi:hypothetical protein
MNDTHIPKLVNEYILTGRRSWGWPKERLRHHNPWEWNKLGMALYHDAGDVDVMKEMQKKCKTKFMQHI